MEKILEARDYILSKGNIQPEVGIVLGTGLGKLVNDIAIELEIPYDEIPHFPEATVEFHQGKLVYGELSDKKVLAMQGRFHLYEGYTANEVVLPIRVMKELGIQKLLLSNAAGAMNLDFKKGDLMMITDHINLLPENPLLGKNHDKLGPRFPDMSEAYSREMKEKIRVAAQNTDVQLQEGVYVSVLGPMLETAAEYRFLRIIGADAVGMSTVPEVIAANHMGLPCAAISVLTDECDPDNLQPIDVAEIIEIASKAEEKLTALTIQLLSLL